MTRIHLLAGAAMLALAACNPAPPVQLGPDGQPLPVAYKISESEASAIPQRVSAQINQLRTSQGLAPMALNPQLLQAAASHARDMASQNRAWHFGSDGSSPVDRISRAGYYGALIGENISETFENDTQTLSAWMQQRDTRDIIMDPVARSLGIGWYQEPSNKIWWVLLTGS